MTMSTVYIELACAVFAVETAFLALFQQRNPLVGTVVFLIRRSVPLKLKRIHCQEGPEADSSFLKNV